jgi:hypothetical protein
MSTPEYDTFRLFCDAAVDREYLIDDAEQRVISRLNRIAPIDRRIPMKDLLKNFRVRYEPLTLADQSLQQALRVGLARMSAPAGSRWRAAARASRTHWAIERCRAFAAFWTSPQTHPP